VKILDQIKMSFALGVGLGNLLGLGRLESHHHPLDPIHTRTGHVDHVLVKAGLGFVQLEHFKNLGLSLFFGLPLCKQSGFFGNGVFQDES
jgi:hypothetical protein